jgi:Tfp pilus assembly protein PilW
MKKPTQKIDRKTKLQAGTTLIEVIIYLALFTIIIGGSLVSVHQIIESTNKLQSKVVLQEEANFILRKINWALNGATNMSTNVTPPSLSITNPLQPVSDSPLVFDLHNGYLRLKRGAGLESNLNSQNVTVSNLVFTYTASSGGKPASIKVSFTLTEKEKGEKGNFETTRYLRI